MHDIICVENRDNAFKEIRNVMDSKIKNAVYSLYIQFSEFTLPIITQDMLRTMENAFCHLLPTQYHCIRSMMGKHVWKDPATTTPEQEICERQWDRIQQCRLRNLHNFIHLVFISECGKHLLWWSRSHISLHFGFSIAKNTMLQKLNEIYNYAELVMKSKETLNQYKSFVIAIFDNLQININKKFQQNAVSSNMAEATCRIFLKPTIFEYLQDLADSWADLDTIPLTHLDQVIPSPYGMPAYKSLPDNWTISDITDEKFSIFKKSIDTSRERVEAYFLVKQTMSVTRRLKRIIPCSSNKLFQFSIPQHNDALFTLSICEKLKNNWQRTIPSTTANVHCSWYHHILKTSY